jgi:1-acyl-sn-glycerol-3-phosphate acyltransferase
MPLIFFDKKYTFMFWNKFSATLDFIIRHVGGIEYTLENPHNILKEPAIYAVRHESTWETLVLIHYFYQPIFVLKKELLDIPLFGPLSRKADTIDVDRESGAKSLINASRRVEQSLAEGHPVIIFPEGTRVSPGVHVEIKRGIALFYKRSNCPVVPVVHNAGKFWHRRGFIKYPGNITLKFLDPIPPGLPQDEFMEKLNSVFHSEIEKLNSNT